MEPKTIKMIATAFELCNSTELTEAAQEMVVSSLKRFDERAVQAALVRCCDEVKGRLTPAHIIERIDDGRPGADAAWAIVENAWHSEGATVVWTDEIRDAFGTVRGMEDAVAARMAFKDEYTSIVTRAKAQNKPIKWGVSLGTDPGSRERVLIEAVERGRLTASRARSIMPELPPLFGEKPQLQGNTVSAEKVKQLVASVYRGV